MQELALVLNSLSRVMQSRLLLVLSSKEPLFLSPPCLASFNSPLPSVVFFFFFVQRERGGVVAWCSCQLLDPVELNEARPMPVGQPDLAFFWIEVQLAACAEAGLCCLCSPVTREIWVRLCSISSCLLTEGMSRLPLPVSHLIQTDPPDPRELCSEM